MNLLVAVYLAGCSVVALQYVEAVPKRSRNKADFLLFVLLWPVVAIAGLIYLLKEWWDYR